MTPSGPISVAKPAASKVLLATADTALTQVLQRILGSLGLPLQVVASGVSAIGAIRALNHSAIVLLDVRLAGSATGQLLAAIQHSNQYRKWAVALIAESVSDEWIAWLREGAIDDIIPLDASGASWRTHLSTMQRGHQLYLELERLRETSLPELRHDRATGVFLRDSMLTLLFRETDRVQRLHGSLSLILFAIDDFEHWTRELGRDDSDRMLREAAVRVGRIQRSYDVLGRMGPQEFLLVLPGCSALDAAMMAERLRTEVFGESFAVRKSSGHGRGESISILLTACFGVTASRGRSPIVVLREAEQTLALSRSRGPDTVRCAGELASAIPSINSLDLLFPEVEILA
ncbi:MAG TPA: diguanylate cyclase [Acidobacteriaceae bacterium]|jgi:diguanylate cyclase (GGDEF)-like protein|nr:diguanylate cyclase [Acidobacteriaceae bacterium]